MAWIESHTVLIRHRKLAELARKLRVRKAHAMGHLHALWHAAMEQRDDGDLSAWSDEFIAEQSDYSGDAPQYVRLLQETGFFGYRDAGGNLIAGTERLLHDWPDYAGAFLRGRYAKGKRERLEQIWEKHGRTYGDGGKPTTFQPPPNKPPTPTNQPTVPTDQPPPEGGSSSEPKTEAQQQAERLGEARSQAQCWVAAEMPSFLRKSSVDAFTACILAWGREKAIATVRSCVSLPNVHDPFAYAAGILRGQETDKAARAVKGQMTSAVAPSTPVQRRVDR